MTIDSGVMGNIEYLNDFDVILNLIKGGFGYGTLLVPYAYSTIPIVAPLVHCICILLCTYILHCVIDIATWNDEGVREVDDDDDGYITIPKLIYNVFERRTSKTISLILRRIFEVCFCLYLLFSTGICLTINGKVIPHIINACDIPQLANDPVTNKLVIVSLGVIPFIFCCWITDIRHYKFFSTLGIMLLMFGIFFALYFKWDMHTPILKENIQISYRRLLIFFPYILFDSIPMGILLPLRSRLGKNTNRLTWLLDWCMAIIFILNALTGVFGCLYTQPNAQRDFFVELSASHMAGWCGFFCCGLGIYFSVFLHFYSLFDFIWYRLWTRLIEFSARLAVVILCIAVALGLCFTQIEPLFAIFGVLCSLILYMILSTHLCLFWRRGFKGYFSLIVTVLYSIIVVVCFIGVIHDFLFK